MFMVAYRHLLEAIVVQDTRPVHDVDLSRVCVCVCVCVCIKDGGRRHTEGNGERDGDGDDCLAGLDGPRRRHAAQPAEVCPASEN